MADPAGQATRIEATEAVAEERLQRAATYIEAEEGATNRYRGALARPGDRAARRHVAVPPLRGDRDRSRAGAAPGPRRLDAAARLPALPDRGPLPQPPDVVGRRLRRARRGDDRLSARRRRRHLGPEHAAEPGRHLLRRDLRAARAGGGAAHVGLDHAVRDRAVPRLRLLRPVAARTVGAPRLRRLQPLGVHVPDARRHLRHGRRRVVVAHHPVHDLRRLPAAFGRRQVLSRLELRGDGQPAQRRRTHGGAGVVPARRPVGFGRRDDGDDRRGRLSDAQARRVRRGSGRAACSRRAASARSSRRRCWAPPPSSSPNS